MTPEKIRIGRTLRSRNSGSKNIGAAVTLVANINPKIIPKPIPNRSRKEEERPSRNVSKEREIITIVEKTNRASGFGKKACLRIILDVNGANWHMSAGSHPPKIL